jgi:hypothetical protein
VEQNVASGDIIFVGLGARVWWFFSVCLLVDVERAISVFDLENLEGG